MPIKENTSCTCTTKTIGIIGGGAFGGLCAEQLSLYTDVVLYDKFLDLKPTITENRISIGNLEQAASQSIVILAVPVQATAQTAAALVQYLQPGAVVIDIASIKTPIVEKLEAILPENIEYLSLHPLFGPNSFIRRSKKENAVVCCHMRGEKSKNVIRFLTEALKLRIIKSTPEKHDREMALIQTLSHILGRVTQDLTEGTDLTMTTPSFEHLLRTAEMVAGDSDALFAAILEQNPYAPEVRKRIADAFAAIERFDGPSKL